MMMVDVLIIGGGPHALTLATLLSTPYPDPCLDSTCSSTHSPACPGSPPLCSQSTHLNLKANCPRGRRKKRVPTNQTCEEPPVPLPVSEIAYRPPLDIIVVDSYGEWTALWDSQFTALNIPHLRSHTLVHTDPINKNALQEFVVKHDRTAELHSLPDQVYILDDNAFFNDMRLGKKERKRLNVATALKKSLSFCLPGTKLSVDFFKQQVEKYNLDRLMLKGTVDCITPVMEDQEERKVKENDGMKEVGTTGNIISEVKREREVLRMRRVKYFQVLLQGGVTLKARQVVMATGPTRAQMANIPSWVRCIEESYPEERMRHTVQLMHYLPVAQQQLQEPESLRQNETLPSPGSGLVCGEGQRVVVIGGGLTSAHVVSIALQQGASHVTWVMRKHLQLKQFDVGDVESLVGRYSHVEHGIKMDGQAYLRQFYNERSLHRRLAMIRQARKGGAVTPEAYIHLQPFIQKGQVDVKTYCQVSEARWCYKSQAWNLSLSTGESWIGDMIWLATGCKLDVNQDPLLSGVMREFPIQVIDGWPCITESLQWAPGCPLYLMGQYTALQVGPHAVNLAGGQAASMRIAKDIMCQQQLLDGEESGKNEYRSRNEEYIQQMHGLLWL